MQVDIYKLCVGTLLNVTFIVNITIVPGRNNISLKGK